MKSAILLAVLCALGGSRAASAVTVDSAALKAAGLATRREIVRADADGRLILRRTLAPWSLVLIQEL